MDCGTIAFAEPSEPLLSTFCSLLLQPPTIIAGPSQVSVSSYQSLYASIHPELLGVGTRTSLLMANAQQSQGCCIGRGDFSKSRIHLQFDHIKEQIHHFQGMRSRKHSQKLPPSLLEPSSQPRNRFSLKAIENDGSMASAPMHLPQLSDDRCDVHHSS